MKKHKIRLFWKKRQAHVALLERRNLFGLIFWWRIVLDRTGGLFDLHHYMHAWCMEYGLDSDEDVEDLK